MSVREYYSDTILKRLAAITGRASTLVNKGTADKIPYAIHLNLFLNLREQIFMRDNITPNCVPIIEKLLNFFLVLGVDFM